MRRLLRHLIVLSLAVGASAPIMPAQDVAEIPEPGNGRMRAVRGRYHTVTEEGDTVLMVVLNEIKVFPPLKFKNKKQEQFYWRTVRDVKKTLPYAKLICETLIETYEYIETFPTQKEREAHLSAMEKAVFDQYKPVLKKFTKSQAKMLIKLINRETNQTSYSILKAFLGSFRASFWQTFGKLFGVNLKSGWNPDKNDEDAIIERVATYVEQGML
ncbi:MAG: DUF4294 domain-containing protein [Pseudoflavonifractor sp.]|nr:DUF4294 domain-containing protein [Pseudoflavonifractor sp.]